MRRRPATLKMKVSREELTEMDGILLVDAVDKQYAYQVEISQEHQNCCGARVGW